MTKNSITEKPNEKQDLFNPQRWGLPLIAIIGLADRLRSIWSRFRECFTTRTHDTSEYAFVYLRGLLTMDTQRNYANIARRVIDLQDDGQNIQHFMSDSPWLAGSVFTQIQSEVCHRPELAGGMLTLDESGDKRSGSFSAGSSRQMIGRLGKVDMGQVGVALGYYQRGFWAMVDARLYLPEEWFDQGHEKLRQRCHIPEGTAFATKAQLGLNMIRQAKAKMPFEIVGCDATYGRDSDFREALDTEGILYIGDVPKNIHVYTKEPIMGIPADTPGKRGRPHSRLAVTNGIQSVQVSSLAEKMTLTPVFIRHSERGLLVYDCAVVQYGLSMIKGRFERNGFLSGES